MARVFGERSMVGMHQVFEPFLCIIVLSAVPCLLQIFLQFGQTAMVQVHVRSCFKRLSPRLLRSVNYLNVWTSHD